MEDDWGIGVRRIRFFLTSLTDLSYVLMRVFFGLSFSFHGAQKLFGFFGGSKVEEPLMLVAGGIELVGGLAIALGIFTQLVSLIAAIEMLAAYFIAHFPRGLWPIENKGELALLYFFVFFVILSRGAGRWSLDEFFSKDTNG